MKYLPLLFILTTTMAFCVPVSLDFEDGVSNTAIDNFYQSSGVVFVNTQWRNGFLTGMSGSIGIMGIDSTVKPRENTALIGLFQQTVDSVSITAHDVGAAGARLEVFASDGGLLGADQFIGSSSGVGTFTTLTVNTANIASFQVFQPVNASGDGVVFDNLSFNIASNDAIPEPSSLILLVAGVTLFAGFRRKA